MKTNTQEIVALVKEKSTVKKKSTSKKDARSPLLGQAIEALNAREDNEYMPYFILNPEDKSNNVFANLFIAQHCRNAYAGLFVRLDPTAGVSLSDKQKHWATVFRRKGYACVVHHNIATFKRCVEDYKHTSGVQGFNYFYSKYERSYQ